MRREHTTQQQARRIHILLGSTEGHSHRALARRLRVDRGTVSRWQNRIMAVLEPLREVCAEKKDKELRNFLVQLINDKPRSGTPVTFTAPQVCAIMQVALEDPKESNRPISHWSSRDLAQECIKRGIVENISIRTVGRFLKEADLKPHKTRYWLNPNIQDPILHEQQVQAVCNAYEQAIPSFQRGVHHVSTDEKTGIQALERLAPTLRMKPGKVERREYDYARHGTLALIPSFEVATGKIISASTGPTRNEQDFADHINRTVDTDPEAVWVFIADQLNTHKSEALVRLVAKRCNINEELGKKEKWGILKSQETRACFLTDCAHRIRFIYTPKHCSWLNQIEIWFSILARRLLKRGNFTSVQNLNESILAFIKYFNQTMARPFKWTYKGRPLQV